jgi:hypothetical protein
MIGPLLTVIGKDLLAQALKRDRSQKPSWNNPISINVVANERQSGARDGENLRRIAHSVAKILK